MKRRNLVFLHLESISWQKVHAFPDAFPNLNRFLPKCRLFRNFYSSATSTQMVLAYLIHGNDFELDAESGLSKPAMNNPGLFSILQAQGYNTDFLCVTAYHFADKKMLPVLADTLPPVWSTGDFSDLLEKFDALTQAPQFAIYVLNLVSHIEHGIALADHAQGLDDLVGGACAVADHALGALIGILENKDLLQNTTIVIFGDHGDDYWTHGFKGGLLHGTEPYTHILHAPLLICDAGLPAGQDYRLVSTIDFAPSILDLLQLPAKLPFADSGNSILVPGEREFAFAQNFAANQPDSTVQDIRKAFSATSHSHSLLVSSRGLELFNHRLDPTNHCNLLNFFEIGSDGNLRASLPASGCHRHFDSAFRYFPKNQAAINREFRPMLQALRLRIQRKQAYLAERSKQAAAVLDPVCFETINTLDRERFFGHFYREMAGPVSADSDKAKPRSGFRERVKFMGGKALAKISGS